MARAKVSPLTYADRQALPDGHRRDEPPAIGRPVPLTVLPADLAR
ncbi:MAG TPA: hypothetical protein VFH36_11035 [Acidimicrobiales bacterium]|jgi:hypothetical protein|nr:hypothetical protein [Acidimicrobiales bacterium]